MEFQSRLAGHLQWKSGGFAVAARSVSSLPLAVGDCLLCPVIWDRKLVFSEELSTGAPFAWVGGAALKRLHLLCRYLHAAQSQLSSRGMGTRQAVKNLNVKQNSPKCNPAITNS